MRLFGLCTFTRFETMIWPSIRFDISLQKYKKRLDIFLPQIERKRSKEYFVIILAVKGSSERFCCLEFICENSLQTPGSKLKTWTKALRLRNFRDTLIEFVNENCFFLYMFYRVIFLLLIVSSLSWNFNRCAVCFQSFMNITCRSTQNAARIKRF